MLPKYDAQKTNLSQPGKTHCKRADASEVKGALQRMDAKPFAAGSYGSLHDVNEKVDGERAVVKVIKGAKMGKAKIYEEVRNLIQVKQFLGWGHKASSDVYYIIMPHMGDPLEKTGMKEKDPKVKELTEEALARYKKDFHMIHGYGFCAARLRLLILLLPAATQTHRAVIPAATLCTSRRVTTSGKRNSSIGVSQGQIRPSMSYSNLFRNPSLLRLTIAFYHPLPAPRPVLMTGGNSGGGVLSLVRGDTSIISGYLVCICQLIQ